MKTILNPSDRAAIFGRFERLTPDHPPRWGTMDAPRMVAHLCDQMRLPFRDEPTAPISGPGRIPILGRLVLYYLPWPKGRVQAPPEGMLTDATSFDADLTTLRALVDGFVGQDARPSWPDHPHFGRMSYRDWGVMSYRHFDHHLRQFGA